MIESMLLGLLQGLAEFLPVSSSGHLVLGKTLFNMHDVGMFFDIMLHVGTLFSIFVVFHKKIWNILYGIFKKEEAQIKEALFIVIASVPTAFIGLFFKDTLENLFVNPKAVCVGLLFTGVLLFLTRWSAPSAEKPMRVKPMNWWRAFLTGVMQGVACIPGISRSGSTTSVMLYLGIDRKYAGEFTFLMSIPAVAGAALLDLKKWISCQGADALLDVCKDSGNFSLALILGMIVSFISGIFALKWLMAFVKKGKLHYFSWYVFAVGVLGLIFLK